MGRIESCFEDLKTDGKTAMVVYIVAGDPEKETTVPLMHAMVTAGANVIELGVPFSDPEGEGPVIQDGVVRSLLNNTSLIDVIEMVKIFRQQDQSTPVVLMGYLNPIETMGYEEFADQCLKAGVDGTIIVNLPPEEAVEYDALLIAKGIDPIYLLAPTTSMQRAAMICKRSRGFVYYVSRKGVTGASPFDIGEVKDRLTRIKKLTGLPVCVGFGIKDESSARQAASEADGVAIGSALVEIIGRLQTEPARIAVEVANWIKKIRTAID